MVFNGHRDWAIYEQGALLSGRVPSPSLVVHWFCKGCLFLLWQVGNMLLCVFVRWEWDCTSMLWHDAKLDPVIRGIPLHKSELRNFKSDLF
jgi:hypothetical protein